jgi:transposase
MEAFGRDLRVRVLAAYLEQGMETAEVAETFDVSPAWARRLKQRFRELGTIDPIAQARRGPAPKLTDADLARLADLVRATPDATLAELRDALAARGADVGATTVWRALDDLGLARKKSRPARASRTGRT